MLAPAEPASLGAVLAFPSRELATEDVVPGGLARPTSATVSQGGLICITDAQDSRVVVLDSEIRLVRVYGSPGDGPGELRRPAVCQADAELVEVVDTGASRLTVYAFDGRVAETHPIDVVFSASTAMLVDGRVLSIEPKGRYVETRHPDGGGPVRRLEIPSEMCELPEPFFLAMFAKVAAARSANRVVVTSQIGCRGTSRVPIAVLGENDASRYVELAQPPHVGVAHARPSDRQIMTVAAVAASDELVGLLYASTGQVDGTKWCRWTFSWARSYACRGDTW